MTRRHKPYVAIPRHGSANNSAEFLRFRIAPALLLFAVLSGSSHAAETTPATSSSTSDPAIVIGFVGGFVHHDDLRHSEVQLAARLRATYGGRAHIAIFENRRRENALHAILQWLDQDGDGALSDSEKRRARIILYGHSWGGSSVVTLSRRLQKEGIPVLLTIQVDSIAKPGRNDQIIPANVARAANFYQTGGPLHGLPEIVAADPARTQILGDFRFDYKKEPEPCSTYPWFARHFLKGHTSIECDPDVWSRVEALISEYLLLPETHTPTALSKNF